MTGRPGLFPYHAGRFLPRSFKLQISRALNSWTSRSILNDLHTLSNGDKPIVAGPWVGEVGFELLYWVPFLSWVTEQFNIAPDRLVVVSRGGVSDWYQHVSSRYHDVFDQLSADEFRTRNTERLSAVGEQKQVVVTNFDLSLLQPILSNLRCGMDRVLHPSTMYRLFRLYLWGHVQSSWIESYAQYRRFEPSVISNLLTRLPSEYVAVKFYYSDSFPATRENRRLVREVMSTLRESSPVVSLSTGLSLDDHEESNEEKDLTLQGIQNDLSPATNLALQSAIVARARSWVGTYGGFAYLAPFYGVPSTAYLSDRNKINRQHLALAQHVFSQFSPESLLEIRETG